MGADIAGNGSSGAGTQSAGEPRVLVYTTAVTIIGLVIAAFALTRLPDNILGLILFAVLAGISELFSVELYASSRSRVSVSSIIAIASILVFGPMAGALTHMVSGLMTLITTTLNSDQPEDQRASLVRRSVFNMGMWVTAAAVAGWVYGGTGGSTGHLADWSNVLPLVAAATADTVTNLGLLIGVIALQTGRNAFEIWRRDFLWAVPISVLGAVLGGGGLALAYEMFGVLGLVVFFLPVLMTGYAFRLYVANTKVYVNELEEANRGLDEANLDLLETLGAVIDADDMYTSGHSAQVAVYAGAIAEKMGLSPDERSAIVRAALIHDVGKVGIRDTIISKQGPLTDDEYRVIKRHPVIGAGIVGRMHGFVELVPTVRNHHERWDGAGYPDGLAERQIPLGARILALADSVDAMYSDRPYRPTRKFRDVLQEISRCSGKQFAPDVVAAFMAVVAEKPAGFFKNSAVAVDTAVVLAGMGSADLHQRYLKRGMLEGSPN